MIIFSRYCAPDTAEPLLQAMFAARKEIFIDLLGWDLPLSDATFERDQFDNDHARYLIVTDTGADHRASVRLLPTSRPHLLGSLFAGLCDDPVPTGGTIVEITRFCLDRKLDAAGRRAARDALVTALVDHALAHGVTAYTAIAELGWMRQIQGFGWRCRPLGAPRVIGGRKTAALLIEIDRHTPALLATAGVISPRDSGARAPLAA